ncbi:hypothetical protein [Micromonospora psammae]|uniref:hypothetical protein n=1 Tax=Micromonospora sp. CPCC 205556 TaxID=3122398 RepID=UPI002FF01977
MPLTNEEHDRLLELYRERVAGYAGVDDDYPRRWREWCVRLLDLGGELVVPPGPPEADLDQLIAAARPHGPAARQVPGEENGCHANAAILWTDATVAAVGTGYALSADGLWRQHSWGVDADGTVVETTFERQRYMGLTLTDIPALQFAASNAGRHVAAALRARGPRARELAALLHTARQAWREA